MNKTIFTLGAVAISGAIAFSASARSTTPQGNIPDGLKAQLQDYTTIIPESNENTLPAAQDLNGEWQLATVGGRDVNLEEDIPYIYFEPSTGRFYGNNGCNVVNGSFSIGEDGNLSFGPMMTTMRYCSPEDAPFEQAFNLSVREDKPLHLTPIYRIGSDSYLTLTDAGTENVVMTLRRKDMGFLNGNWQIVMADGVAINDEEANVFFDMPELKMHGNTGCNFVNGTIYLDPRRPNSIDISNIAITKMGCPKTAQERAVAVALEEAYTAMPGEKVDTALLLDKSGKVIMKLVRANASSEE